MNLEGKTTPGGWLITEPVVFPQDQTGGYFSACYFATKDGQRAFLKALDIAKFNFDQLLGVLAGFQYETDLVKLCKDKQLVRIVQMLESGRIESDPAAPPALRFVPFIVFELAESDVRKSVDVSQQVSNQWRFQVLHQTTLALLQLHGASIAHQDLKPSNVLQFAAGKLKLGDLGRSSLRGKAAPHDDFICAGASNYAPFEHRYGTTPSDWVERRLSTDVFHLGCLVVFVFTNLCLPEFVMERLAEPYKPDKWGESYSQVVAHVRAAMVQALDELRQDFPAEFRADLVSIVRDLCDPSPADRGRTGLNVKTVVGLLWLQRYVSRFDVLEKRSRLKRPEATRA